MIEGDSHCIVQCRLAISSDSGKGNFQLTDLVCKRHVIRKTERNLFVEIDQEHLVLWVAGTSKYQCSRNHVTALRHHASTVVDDQTDGYRDIFVAEILDRFKHSVFVNLEIFFGE